MPHAFSLRTEELRLPMSTASFTAGQTFELRPYKSLDNQTLERRIHQVKADLGSRLLVLGHHYQQDEVIALADSAATATSSAAWRPIAWIAGRLRFAAYISWPKRPTSWPTGLSGSKNATVSE